MTELIVFTADYCTACKMVEPILEKFEDENLCKVTTINLSHDEGGVELANKYFISSLPGFVIKKNGEAAAFTGAQTEDFLREMITG